MVFRRNKCKLCGGKAFIKFFRTRYGWKCYVFCRKCYCGFIGFGNAKEEAKAHIAERWNKCRPRRFKSGVLDWGER